LERANYFLETMLEVTMLVLLLVLLLVLVLLVLLLMLTLTLSLSLSLSAAPQPDVAAEPVEGRLMSYVTADAGCDAPAAACAACCPLPALLCACCCPCPVCCLCAPAGSSGSSLLLILQSIPSSGTCWRSP